MAKDERNKKNKNPKKSFLKESKAELKRFLGQHLRAWLMILQLL